MIRKVQARQVRLAPQVWRVKTASVEMIDVIYDSRVAIWYVKHRSRDSKHQHGTDGKSKDSHAHEMTDSSTHTPQPKWVSCISSCRYLLLIEAIIHRRPLIAFNIKLSHKLLA